MLNAVTNSLAAAIVPSDFSKISNISNTTNKGIDHNSSNIEINNNQSSSTTAIKQEATFESSNSPSPNKSLNSSSLTTSSLSSSSSNSEVNSTISNEEQQNRNTSGTNNSSNSNTNEQPTLNSSTNSNKANKPNSNYYHPNQMQHQLINSDLNQVQYLNPHPIPISLNHFNFNPNPQLNGIQYIQFNSNANNSTPTPLNSVSPISSSLTSSPSTTTTSIQYLNHSQHLNKHMNHHNHHHHHSNGYAIHGTNGVASNHHPVQQQQFQQLQFHSNYKDTRWLTLEVCREFQRNKCNRNETECKFAHPLAHVEIINGKVIACYDSLKGKCTRKEPPCKYLHPPQHLRDQLLQNGKNNLVLRQVALAMMQQQQQQHTNVQTNSEAILAAAAASAPTRTTPLTQYTTFTTTSPTNTTNPSVNSNSQSNSQFISTNALTNGGLTTYPQVQLATNAHGQTHLLQMIASPNGFHHPHQNLHIQQQATPSIYTNDLLHQVNTVNQPGVAQTVTNNMTNSMLLPQQRTDRLQLNELNETANGTIFSLENGQAYQVPQYQIYTPIYQRASNVNISNQQANSADELNQQADIKANSASATNATAVANNVVDIVPGKKRQHDAIEQDFIPMSSTNIYPTSNIPVKRTALTDAKTGMPIQFQTFPANALHLAGQTGQNIHHFNSPHAQTQSITIPQQLTTLNYPAAFNFATMQYAPYPTAFSLPFNGQSTSIPRL